MKFGLNKRKLFEALIIRLMFAALLMLGSFMLLPPQGAEPSTFPVASERQPIKATWVVATAYSSDVNQTDNTPCIPAADYDLCQQYEQQGFGNTIAANFLPLETQVKLPDLFGEQIFVVRDRMNERYGLGRIDVWLPTRAEAETFGVKYIKMEQFGGGAWRWQMARR